jgi:hypothetical protein
MIKENLNVKKIMLMIKQITLVMKSNPQMKI